MYNMRELLTGNFYLGWCQRHLDYRKLISFSPTQEHFHIGVGKEEKIFLFLFLFFYKFLIHESQLTIIISLLYL